MEEPMNCETRRLTLTTLKRLLKSEFGLQEYQRRMKRNEPEPYPRLNHVVGATTKLSDIKAIYPNLTCRKIVALNDAFVSKRIHICKYCSEPHYSGCCEKYNYDQRSSCHFISNLALDSVAPVS